METDFSDYSQATTSGPDFSSSSMGLSDEAMASIGSSQNQDQSFFGGNSVNVMDFGRGPVSNITNAANYDPNFAALGMIGRGLTPGFDLRNQISFNVPSQMLPQIEGKYGPIGAKYYSPVERTLVEMEPIGIMSVIGKGLSSLLDGVSFLNNSKAGSTIEETVDAFGNRVDPNAVSPLSATGAVDAFGTPVSRAEQTREANLGFGLGSMMTDPSFMGRPTVTKTSLDKLVDRPSIAQLAEDRKKQNALNSIFDMLNKNTQNIEIAAGTNAGKTLNPELPVSFPYGRSGGYNLSVLSSRGDVAKPNPVQGPPSPFFPDQITPTERPFATTDQVALRSSPDGYYFANAFNRPLDATRTSDKYRTPINEEEARAEEFAAYNFSSIPKGTDPIEFINRRDLPSDLQGIVSLNRDLDYGSTIPLSYYFDQTARGKAEERTRLEKIREAEEALANLPRFYPDSGTAGLPGLY